MLPVCLIVASALHVSSVLTNYDDSSRVAPTPFYVGVQVGAYRFSGLGQTDANGNRLSYKGIMPLIGAHVSTRSSIEMTAMWRRPNNGPITVVDYPNGGRYRYYDRYESHVIPVLYRYSVLRKPQQWNIEAIAGISLLHSRVEGYRSITEAGQPEQPFALAGLTEANDLPLALGMAITYSPSQHWTLVGEGRLNWSILGSAATAAFFGGVFLPQNGGSLSLRYNFGLNL